MKSTIDAAAAAAAADDNNDNQLKSHMWDLRAFIWRWNRAEIGQVLK